MLNSRKVRAMLGGALVVGVLAAPMAAGALASPHVASVIVTLDNTPAGWNNFTSATNDFRVGQIESQIWPAPYITDNHGKFVLDKFITTSVTPSTKNGQQVITYKINPKAVWSDGVPLRADDFMYMWQAQAGVAAWKDKGGVAFDDASNSGYNQIQSIVGSKPLSTAGKPQACINGSPAPGPRPCENGATVTVTFKLHQSYPEVVGLFGMLPAHIARAIGWNTGFENAADARNVVLSAGPYVLHSYNLGSNTFTETPNPKWWGPAPHFGQLIFKDLASDNDGIAGLAAGDYNVFEPTTPSLAMTQQAQNYPGQIQDQLLQSFQFEHFDFNQSNVDMKKLQVRQAIAYGVDRPALIAATVGQILTTKQLDNHIVLANQPGYAANGHAYDIGGTAAGVKKSIALLKAAHYFYNTGDKWFHKGSKTGPILTFQFWYNGTAARAVEEQIFQGEMRQIGVKIQPNVAPNGTILGSDNFDIVVFAWVGSPLLSGNKDIYGCGGGSNYDNFCYAGFDKLAKQANASTSVSTETKLYNSADKVLWNEMATLPLYQKPQYGAWTTNIKHVLVNPTLAGIVWNAQAWTN